MKEQEYRLVPMQTQEQFLHFAELVKMLDVEYSEVLGRTRFSKKGEDLTKEINNVYLIYIENQAVACGGLREFQPGVVEIKRMFVHPSFRSRGLSRMILNKLEEQARALGYDTAVLYTREALTAAVHLYKSQGYEEVKIDKVFPGITMQKKL